MWYEKEGIHISQYRGVRCYELAGRELRVSTDGNRLSRICFPEAERIVVDLDGKRYAASCTVMKPHDDVYYIHCELSADAFRRGLVIVYDAVSGLITALAAKQGHDPERYRRVERDILFGAVYREDGSLPEMRHAYTDMLTGHEIEYSYSSCFTVLHRYLDAHHVSWIITREDNFPENIGVAHTEHCDVIQIRPELILFSWLETDSGTQGSFLLNLSRMAHVGSFFGVGPDGLPESYSMGAFARVCG